MVIILHVFYIVQKMKQVHIPNPLHELDNASDAKHNFDGTACDADHKTAVESTEDNIEHNDSIDKASNEEEEGQLVEEKEEKDVSNEEGWVYLKQNRVIIILYM